MKREKYYPPKQSEEQYHCPHCGVFAKQLWAHITAQHVWSDRNSISEKIYFTENFGEEWTISKCEHCDEKSIWLKKEILYPKKMIVEQPNNDLSDDIKKDYLEAAIIFNDSLRSSAALLRLTLQKLCKQLGEKGKNINDDIKNLVKKGLNPQIQKSLDILRITGNNAIHPGEINVEEKPDLY